MRQGSPSEDGSPLTEPAAAAGATRSGRVTARNGDSGYGSTAGTNAALRSSADGSASPPRRETSSCGGGAFHIIVAARIRPFSQSELKRWRKERQKQLAAAAALSAQASAVPTGAVGGGGGNGAASPSSPTPPALSTPPAVANVRAVRAALQKQRHGQRRPFGAAGPASEGRRSGRGDGDAELGLVAPGAAHPDVAEALRNAAQASLPDSQESPLPVVDVEPDQRTLTLLDPAHPGLARGVFTLDHVFSSFAPTVEMPWTDAASRRHGSGGHAEEGARVNMSTAILSEDTHLSPAQEHEAEQEQARIYELLGVPLLESALHGYNACIFAYGQTSSGKTYTMLGTKRHWGVIPRLLHSLFQRLGTPATAGTEEQEVAGASSSYDEEGAVRQQQQQQQSLSRQPVRAQGRTGEDEREDAGHQADLTSGSPVSLPSISRASRGPRQESGSVPSALRSAVGSATSSSPSTYSSPRKPLLGDGPHVPVHRLSHSSDLTHDRANVVVHVDVSYMEIYNEKVRDLLKQRPKNAILHYNSRFDVKDVDFNEYQNLRVRQHPQRGLFVDGLSSVRVSSWAECERFLKQGNQLRTQAATSMNETSSRSHTIFQVTITREENLGGRVRGKAVTSQRLSKIKLVDLAGSERNSASATSTKGRKSHVQEANSINVSLSTLRRVIDALVTNSNIAAAAAAADGGGAGGGGGGGASARTPVLVPYRESLLTYVLSDNFGGNCKTVMCATVSPSEHNLSETESTLRYATLARGVRNRVKLNEDPSARVIHELQHRIHQLQEELASMPSPKHVAELELDLEENAAALTELQEAHAHATRTLQAKASREAQLMDALKHQQEQEAQWKREAARERERNARLEAFVQRLQEENRALAAAAETGQATERGGSETTEAPAANSVPFLDSSAVMEAAAAADDDDDEGEEREDLSKQDEAGQSPHAGGKANANGGKKKGRKSKGAATSPGAAARRPSGRAAAARADNDRAGLDKVNGRRRSSAAVGEAVSPSRLRHASAGRGGGGGGSGRAAHDRHPSITRGAALHEGRRGSGSSSPSVSPAARAAAGVVGGGGDGEDNGSHGGDVTPTNRTGVHKTRKKKQKKATAVSAPLQRSGESSRAAGLPSPSARSPRRASMGVKASVDKPRPSQTPTRRVSHPTRAPSNAAFDGALAGGAAMPSSSSATAASHTPGDRKPVPKRQGGEARAPAPPNTPPLPADKTLAANPLWLMKTKMQQLGARSAQGSNAASPLTGPAPPPSTVTQTAAQHDGAEINQTIAWLTDRDTQHDDDADADGDDKADDNHSSVADYSVDMARGSAAVAGASQALLASHPPQVVQGHHSRHNRGSGGAGDATDEEPPQRGDFDPSRVDDHEEVEQQAAVAAALGVLAAAVKGPSGTVNVSPRLNLPPSADVHAGDNEEKAREQCGGHAEDAQPSAWRAGRTGGGGGKAKKAQLGASRVLSSPAPEPAPTFSTESYLHLA